MTVRLFNKREIFFRGLHLEAVNLDQVAAVVAGLLGLAEQEVLVVDARDDLLTLDILNDQVAIDRIAGKGPALLRALAGIPGITVGAAAEVHSEGVLGMVNLPEDQARTLPAATAALDRQIRGRLARRAIVLPTGSEIIAGQIEDTNTPFLVAALQAAGFTAQAGPAVADDLDSAIGALGEAAFQGFGLVVSTGGTGAEAKDCLIEAILALDPTAATPYVVRYRQGHGRHHKDGVRLAVGQVEPTTYVALTGPHREVRLLAPILLRGLDLGWSKQQLAESLAGRLRELLPGGHG